MSKKLSQVALFNNIKGAELDRSGTTPQFGTKVTAAIMAAGALAMASPSNAESTSVKSGGMLSGERMAKLNASQADEQMTQANMLNLDGLRSGEVSLNDEVARLQRESMTTEPPAITPDNVDALFASSKSGVYQNPLKPEHNLSLHFLDDKHASEHLNSDIERYGMDTQDYAKHAELKPKILSAFSKSPEGNLSQHIARVKEDKDSALESDVNLTFVDTREDTLIMPLNDKYDRYYLLSHEAAHALPSQQVTTDDLVFLDRDQLDGHTLFSENSADYIATAKMSQAMLNDGHSIDAVNDKIDKIIESRKNEYANVMSVYDTGELSNAGPGEKPVGASDHYTAPTLEVVKRVLNEDPEHFQNASNEQLIKEANTVSANLMRYDFMPEMKEAQEHRNIQADEPLVEAIAQSKNGSTKYDSASELGNIRNAATQHIMSHYSDDYGGFVNKAAGDILQKEIGQKDTKINSPFEMVR